MKPTHMKSSLYLFTALLIFSCSNNNGKFDATGTFEATETIVSSEATGKLLSFTLEEGQVLKKGQKVGAIDSTQLYLTKLQLRESQKAVLAGKPDIRTQVEATKKEIENTLVEKRAN
jgi:HlyD family secretion protein